MQKATKMKVPKSSSLSPTCHQHQECVLYGVVSESMRNQLIQRLAGLCDPENKAFSEHEMIFTLKVASDNPLQVRLRRRLQRDKLYWHCRYIGTPQTDANCPTIIRKTVDSMIFSNDMMEFVKSIGLRMDYELVMDGILFTKGNIRVTISHIKCPEKTGQYAADSLKPLLQSHLVEATCILSENSDYMPAARALREFSDHLSPLCELKKLDYWKI